MVEPIRLISDALLKWMLVLLAVGIWFSDLDWWRLSPDVLVILVLFPITWWLSRQHSNPIENVDVGVISRFTWIFAVLLGGGIALQSMTVMAVSWSGLAVWWFFPPSRIPRARLCVICAGAFPWVLLDFNALGWMFRLSGAAVTAVFFETLGYDVTASGTQLTVGGLPISVEAACGGLQLLQVLLSGGALLSLLRFPTASGFWWMLASLPLLAWLSNTLRIIAISAWGLMFGLESAAGAFHTWGALLVLACMLVLLMGVVNIIGRIHTKAKA